MATLAARGEQLMLSTLSLWILQTTMPVLQDFLPYLSLTTNSQQLAIPLAQALNQLVGLLTCLSAYCLLYQRAAGTLSLKTNLLFVTIGFCITTGHGMHTVCVLVEEKVLHQASIHALVDFLHEVVSHNMFVAGIYCLMGLLMKTERDSLTYKLEKKTDDSIRDVEVRNGDAKLSNGRPQDQKLSPGSSNRQQSSGFLLLWAWPVVLGVYFTIFSTRTGTVPITVVFYLAVYAYTILTAFKLAEGGLSSGEFISLLNKRELTVFGTIAKSSCIGLPVLALLWYTNIIMA